MAAIGQASTAATHTATQAAPHAGAGIMNIVVIVALVLMFYFLMIRPQSKRAKERRNLLDSINVGDEVVTAGGIVGKIIKLDDNYMEITISNGVDIKVQRSSVSMVLPKGSA